jgi:hypothetical protein
MKSWHVAYLFDPAGFVTALGPHLDGLAHDRAAAYVRLRAAALAAVTRDAPVRAFLDEYGEWRPEPLLAAAPADQPRGFHDIAFWFVILLYAQLPASPVRLGLGGLAPSFEAALGVAGWEARESALLVHGHPFAELARRVRPAGESSGYWQHLQAVAPDGRVVARFGWLANDDVRRLKQLLLAAKAGLADVARDPARDFSRLGDAYQSCGRCSRRRKKPRPGCATWCRNSFEF